MAPPARSVSMGRIPKKSSKTTPQAPSNEAPVAKKPKRFANGVEPEAPTIESNAAAIKLICNTLNRYNVIWKNHGIDPRNNNKSDIKKIVRNIMVGSMGLGGEHICARELDTVDFRGSVMVTKFATCTAAEALLANSYKLKNADPKAMQKKNAHVRKLHANMADKPSTSATHSATQKDPRSGAVQNKETSPPTGGKWKTVYGRNKSKRRADTTPDTPRSGAYKTTK